MSPSHASSRTFAPPPHEGPRAATRRSAADLGTILRQLILHRIHDLFQRDALLVLLIAGANVDRARLDRPLADRNADGDADQVRVGETDAWGGLAIVPEDFESGFLELAVEIVARLDDLHLLVVDRDDLDLIGGDFLRPHDARVVVMVLDGGREDAIDADAVAAHDHRVELALFVEVDAVHLLRVARAQFEDVAHLDSVGEAEFAAAARAGIALHRHPVIADRGGPEIAVEIDVREVRVLLVRAGHEIGEPRDHVGAEDGELEARGPREPDRPAGLFEDFFRCRHLERLPLSGAAGLRLF